MQQLKQLYFKYKQSNLLEKNGLHELLRCVENTDFSVEGVFQILEIKNYANFGQFLSIIPLLLENYSKIMQNL